MADLEFQFSETPAGHVLKISGEAGIPQCAALERQMTMICARRPKRVVFDLSGLTFIGSLGMGCLVDARRGLKPWGGEVVLAALQPLVLEALTHASLNRAFPIFATVEQALAAPPPPTA